ncbi:MAG: hypothetical protein HFG49_07020 [Lachnospiraceae bacterium]|jgi:hypothetical protein|nr:hypothetical protein [Lachnospiraceae bacterium]
MDEKQSQKGHENRWHESSNIDDLFDIQKLHIDTNLPREERIRQFLDQIKNPYQFRYGDMVIRVRFADNGISLRDRIQQYFRLTE